MNQSPDTNIDTDLEISRPRLRTDHHIWGIIITLLLIATVELFSASSQEVSVNDIYGPILRQAKFIVAGILIMIGLQHIHYRHIDRWLPVFIGISVLVMIYVMFNGVIINGARRGMRIGSQVVLPAEFLKLSAALGVGYILSRCQIPGKRGVTTKGVVISAGFVLFCGGLLFSQGLTNTVLLMAISLAMMLIGGVSWRHFGIVLLVYGVVGAGGYLYKSHTRDTKAPTPEMIERARLNHQDVTELKHTGDRSATWDGRLSRHFRLDKYKDTIRDINAQEQYSFIGQARGGITGVGIGNSRETTRLPLAFSDYIFAIIVEEGGLFAGLFVLACYLWLLARAGHLAMVYKSTLPCLLTIGAALFVVFQALFHICIVVGVFPVSGQPLPLISKGGFSVLATSIALGIMLSASRHAARKNDEEEAIRRELAALPDNLQSENPSQL